MKSLEVRNVVKDFRLQGGRGRKFRAVDDVSITLEPGKTIALVGESGSGKSTIARMIAKLETPTSGEILIDGKKSATHGKGLRDYRHNVQMVFQDPFASLNPFHTIQHHLERPLKLHGKVGANAAGGADAERLNHEGKPASAIQSEVYRLLERVNLTPPEVVALKRPHEMSGGQRQRVAIARALAPGARFLIADEPVSMLDVSIRLSVLNLLARLQREDNLGVLYITHDLATARHFSDEIIVMFKGKIVERGPSDEVILNPQHEYTKLLLSAAPNPENYGKLREEVLAEMRLGAQDSDRDRFGTRGM